MPSCREPPPESLFQDEPDAQQQQSRDEQPTEQLLPLFIRLQGVRGLFQPIDIAHRCVRSASVLVAR